MAIKSKPTNSGQSITTIKVTQADTGLQLSSGDCPCIITNPGATGACTVYLPTSLRAGETVEAMCQVDQTITLDPGDQGRIIGVANGVFGDLTSGDGMSVSTKGSRIVLVHQGRDESGVAEWVATLQTSTALVDDILNAIGDNNGSFLVSGGEVTYPSQGLALTVQPAVYYINGVRYTSEADTVTLSAGDATNPRIDVVYVDSTGAVGVLEGTAAADPVKPQVDPASQLELTLVTVAAEATDLDDVITSVSIYAENTEWTSSTTDSGTITLASTGAAHAGTKSIRFNAAASGDNVTLNKGSAQDMTGATNLVMWIKSTATWGVPVTNHLRFSWRNTSGNQIGSTRYFGTGQRGFDSTNTTDWQRVVIPISEFGIGINSPFRLLIEARGSGISCYLDDISIQVGAGAATAANLQNVVEDLTPELGGDLDASNLDIYDAKTVTFEQEVANTLTTGAATINWQSGQKQKVTLDAAATLTFTAPDGPCNLLLKVVQDEGGENTVTWPASVKWPGGTAPTLTSTGSAVDIVTFYWDGTNYHGVASLAFAVPA